MILCINIEQEKSSTYYREKKTKIPIKTILNDILVLKWIFWINFSPHIADHS